VQASIDLYRHQVIFLMRKQLKEFARAINIKVKHPVANHEMFSKGFINL
jgi:hypothetical protein